jgi:hypothetical protein
MTRHVDPQNSADSTSMAWSAELARSIAGQRQRMKALSQGHELRIQNLERAVNDAIEGLLDAEDVMPPHAAPPQDVVIEHEERRQQDWHSSHKSHVEAATPEPRKAKPATRSTPTAADSNNWESYKRQMLEALDAESEETEEVEPELAEERLTIEGTIRITDEMVAERDQEISRLNHLLETYQQNTAKELIGSYEAAFSMDELIIDQRKRLAEAEVALMEKRRLAEVELSQQRAKLARELAELEEKRRALDAERTQLGLNRGEAPSSDAPPSGKPARRWLARLGLKESDTGENDGRQ